MGGGSGGRLAESDFRRLEERAQEELSAARNETNAHVYLSFDHEDLGEVNLFRGQARNENADLRFDDYSVREPFDSPNAEYIKARIREKIDRCSVTVVYLTERSASSKWVDWEIEESVRRDKGVIGFYKGDTAPASVPPAFRQNQCKSVKWEHAALMEAIRNARRTR